MKDICKVSKILNKKQGLSHAKLYLTSDNKIIKSIPIKKDTESKWLKKVNSLGRNSTDTKKNNINKLFNLYLDKKRCQKNNYYLFYRLNDDLKNLLIENITKEDKKNILKQCLLATYILNNKLNIYHNDLYYTFKKENKLGNFMYKKIKKEFKVEIDGMKVDVKKYNIKIIDFGQSRSYPYFSTIKYSPPELKIVSECFLVGYYFFLNTFKIENPGELRSFFVEGGLKIIKELEEKDDLNLQNYDKEIINFYMKNFDDIYTYYNK
jgi:hypothetical protein